MNRTLSQQLGDTVSRIRMLPSILWRIEARLKGARCAADVRFIGRPVVRAHPGSLLELSSGVRINSHMRSNPLGCPQPCVIRTLGPEARMILGPSVGLSGTVISAGLSVEIGECTIIGSGCLIVDNDFHKPSDGWTWLDDCVTTARPVQIGRGCFIGARSIILKGVTIGDRAIIGAGSVVTRDVPPNALAAGNPATILRS